MGGWAQSVSGAAVVKWIGWPKNEQGVMSGDAKACIAEIRWGSGVEAEKFVGKVDWEAAPFDCEIDAGWSGWE